MKKIISAVLLVMFITACTKTDSSGTTSKGNITSARSAIEKFIIPEDFNDEARRVVEDVKGNEYEVGVIDNPNFGRFSSHPESMIDIGGKTPADVSITLNETEYKPDDDGQWHKSGLEFKSYYGKDVNVIIKKAGVEIKNARIHIPVQVQVKMLSTIGTTQYISRAGNTLTWNADSNNVTKKVALYYNLYDREDFDGNGDGLYKVGLVPIADNGNYNIDDLIKDEKCKKIFFQMVNGNTTSCDIEGKKLLFHISTFDAHEYLIK